MSERAPFFPQKGEHALVVGQNGSGKTAFVCWLVEHIPEAPGVIYDTKDEPKFAKLPASIVVETMAEAIEYRDNPEYDYIVVRPPVLMMREPKQLDQMLWEHYEHFHHCFAYIDEAYTFQLNGRAGPGLTALLTRGRSKGISTIISTQRPVRLDRFCITEAKKVYVFRLTDMADKKRLDDVIPNFSKLPAPPKYGFYYFAEGEDAAELMRPIKLDASMNTGYTDQASIPEGEHVEPEETLPTKHVWL